jgi:hypothetical protein
MSKHFAVIEGDTVVNCIVADSQEVANSVVAEGQACIEFVPIKRNTRYVDGQFIAQEPETVELSWAMQ